MSVRLGGYLARRAPRRGWSACYGTLSDADETFFRASLPAESILQDTESLSQHNTDWLQQYRGRSRLVLCPGDVSEVSKIMAYCNERHLAVVPQGGNTGLVGGSVPVGDEIIVSLKRLNAVRGFDALSGVLTCDAGCVLATVDDYLAGQGHQVPLDLGSKGSCMLGGVVSTNAGGLRLLRFGSLRGSVLGLEVVLADGTVLSTLGGLRKDNTGYDLKQLFIGAEGTLGVVTGVSFLAPPRFSARNVALLALADYSAACDVFVEARTCLGEILSACEFWDRAALEMLLRRNKAVGGAHRDPMPDIAAPFYVLVETSGSDHGHDQAKLTAFLENVVGGSGLDGVLDGVVAGDGAQAARLWSMREDISVALSAGERGVKGHVYKYDVSLPVDALDDATRAVSERLRSEGVDEAQVVQYGHLGDGNLHCNIWAPEFSLHTQDMIEDTLYSFVAEKRGSISAEHGLGVMKREKIRLSKSKESVAWMGKVKELFDPNGILNPGKLLPNDVFRSAVE